MTRLRKIMLEELQRRNYADTTIRHYLRFVERFAQHFGKSPDKLGSDHLRTYQAYLLKQRKLAPATVEHHISALRFFFVRVLRRPEFREFLPYPRVPQKLPCILSMEEVARLINASDNLFQRTLLMVLYGTGMRRSEVARLKVDHIDSQRMIIHVIDGKFHKDRDLPLSAALLETLRAYWRWRRELPTGPAPSPWARRGWSRCAPTGAGSSRRPIYSPHASIVIASSPSPTRRCGFHVRRGAAEAAFAKRVSPT